MNTHVIRLSLKVWSHPAAVRSRKALLSLDRCMLPRPPTIFAKPSILPKESRVILTTFLHSSSSVRSALMATALRPALLTYSAILLASASLMSTTAISAPSEARTLTTPSPIPGPAPATTATLPSNFILILLFYFKLKL